jgi:uncharacterized damage-inducible protein DinB
MKSYFLKLFNYDQLANKAILQIITDAGESKQVVKLMAHLLAAQQIWFNRCNNLPEIAALYGPDWQVNTFEKLINDNHTAWIDFISGLEPEDFQNIIPYKNSRGDGYENKIEDILAHVINHGTHHRAQMGQQLKLAGVENLPITDYIFYIR